MLTALVIVVAAGYTGALLTAGAATRAAASPVGGPPTESTNVPRVVVRPSKGVDAKLDRQVAVQIAADLQRRRRTTRLRRVTIWLEARSDQFPAIIARLEWPSSMQLVEMALSHDGYRIARVLGPR